MGVGYDWYREIGSVYADEIDMKLNLECWCKVMLVGVRSFNVTEKLEVSIFGEIVLTKGGLTVGSPRSVIDKSNM